MKVGGLSMSVFAITPLADSGASVSVSVTSTGVITAGSLTPVIVTATSCGVPSAASTVKVSTLVCPAPSVCTALLATL